ncbi:MAG: hypothetical protein HQM11_03755 [SAR324 cluster bacterium]|nr:hypothetical protein [SAR324 cluster bacterium]
MDRHYHCQAEYFVETAMDQAQGSEADIDLHPVSGRSHDGWYFSVSHSIRHTIRIGRPQIQKLKK